MLKCYVLLSSVFRVNRLKVNGTKDILHCHGIMEVYFSNVLCIPEIVIAFPIGKYRELKEPEAFYNNHARRLFV